MGLPAINFQSTLQIGAMDPLSMQGSQSAGDFQAIFRGHHRHHRHHGDDNGQGQQLGQNGQSMVQQGQQLVQQGQNGMGLTSLLSGAGPLLAMFA